MIISALAFMSVYLLTWPALVGLVLLGAIFEYNNCHKSTVFMVMVTAAVAYFFFNISLLILGLAAVAYLVFGIIWSFWRYKRYVDKQTEMYVDSSVDAKARLIKNLHPKEQVGNIVTWIIVWPFSLLENVLSDIVVGLKMLVTNVFRSVYNKIYESAIAKLS